MIVGLALTSDISSGECWTADLDFCFCFSFFFLSGAKYSLVSFLEKNVMG